MDEQRQAAWLAGICVVLAVGATLGDYGSTPLGAAAIARAAGGIDAAGLG
jgi:hypothetical protein